MTQKPSMRNKVKRIGDLYSYSFVLLGLVCLDFLAMLPQIVGFKLIKLIPTRLLLNMTFNWRKY